MREKTIAYTSTQNKRGVASTRDLTRILIYLDYIDEPVTKNHISKEANIVGRINDALLWLVNHKLIKFVSVDGRNLYTLNDREE